METRRIPFRVDMKGIVQILGNSLYSRTSTPVRELIQNAHDGIVRRRRRDLDHVGCIRVRVDATARTLSVEDDGVGLDEAEAEAYLGTLGLGLTGITKRNADELGPSTLIGQFGIGLLSGFLLADRIVVESRSACGAPPVRWEAGGEDLGIVIGPGTRDAVGTAVTLHLKPDAEGAFLSAENLERTIRSYADFLDVPIHLGDAAPRVNCASASWLEPTLEPERVEEELHTLFEEAPLAVLPIRIEGPHPVRGALYVTHERTPGFTSRPVVTVTVGRMIIGRDVRDLVPGWATFLRGVLELSGCHPTASREDLVRDAAFQAARAAIEEAVFTWFEGLSEQDPARLDALVRWHRYGLAGAALGEPRLRRVLERAYPLHTSQGPLSFGDLLARSAADPVLELEADRVVWFHAERRQEPWISDVFAEHPVPCVHALRTFEESLLAAFVADARGRGERVDLRPALMGTPGFAEQVLGARQVGPAPEALAEFLAVDGAEVRVADLHGVEPVLAFLDERRELQRAFDGLVANDDLPRGFRGLITQHIEAAGRGTNQLLLNGRSRLVEAALREGPTHPLASVLRLQAVAALERAGATKSARTRENQQFDLAWIEETLRRRTT